jgi:hypothetical protein
MLMAHPRLQEGPDMSMRAVEFVENWASENITPDEGQPGDAGAKALALASQCLEAARTAGIPQSEIEETFDDLPAFMAGEIEEANGREGASSTTDE